MRLRRLIAAPAADEPVRTNRRRTKPCARALARPRAQQFSTWDFLWLCIAGLIAYDLGRGTATATPAAGAMGSPDDGPPPTSAG